MNNPSLKSYRPGSWYAVIGESVTVLLPAQEKDRVASLWALVDGGADFTETLDHLLVPGLSTLSGFALLSHREGRVQALCRGPVRARFTTDQGEVLLDGSGAVTWSQAYLDGVSQAHLEVDEDEFAVADLTVVEGLVRAQRVSSPATESEVGPVVEPALVEESALGVAPVPEQTVAWAPEDEDHDANPEEHSFADGWGVDAGEPAFAPLAAVGESVPEPTPEHSPIDSSTIDPYQAAPEPSTVVFDQVEAEQYAEEASAWEEGDRAVARVILTTGESIPVDKALLFGRAPEARRFQVGEEPRLVAVPSPHQEISSTHLEIRPGTDDQTGMAVVTDLGSTNGTVIVQPGSGPEELQPGIAVALVPGAVVDLGDGVTLQITTP